MREACHQAGLTYHVRRHMGTTFSHITSSNSNQIGLQNIHLCDNQTDIWTESLVRNDSSSVERCVRMGFTVKKANREGPAPLLASTLTEGEKVLDAFQTLQCLQAQTFSDTRRRIWRYVPSTYLILTTYCQFLLNLILESFTSLGSLALLQSCVAKNHAVIK